MHGLVSNVIKLLERFLGRKRVILGLKKIKPDRKWIKFRQALNYIKLAPELLENLPFLMMNRFLQGLYALFEFSVQLI